MHRISEETKIYIFWLLAIMIVLCCILIPAGAGEKSQVETTTTTETSQVTTKPTTAAITKVKITTLKKKTTKKTTKKKTTTKAAGNKQAYKDYAHDLVINKYHWTEEDFKALDWIWNRESRWNPYAENKKSGAYGIPQAYPAKKMAKAGDDWRTNYKTQINWGLNYIKKRYGSPLKAKQHYLTKGYY